MRPGRPAYSVGNSITLEAKLGGLVELTEDWLLAFTLSVKRPDAKIANSPLVGDNWIIKGFSAVTYFF